MFSFHDPQSPLTTTATVTKGGTSETASPFSSSIEAIRARLNDVVRNIDDVIGTAKRVHSPTASRFDAAGTAVLSPKADRRGVKDCVEGRRLYGSPTSRAATVALPRAGEGSVAPSSAEPCESCMCEPSPAPHSAWVSNRLPTPGPSVATPVTASYSREGTSSASATAETEAALSGTYAATLDFWRVDGRRTFRSAPTVPPGLTEAPGATAAPASTTASTPSAAPVSAIQGTHAIPSFTFAPPPPLHVQRRGTAAAHNVAEKAPADPGIVTDTSVMKAQVSNVSTKIAGTTAAQADRETLITVPRWPLRAAVPALPAAAAISAMGSRSSTSDGSRIRHEPLPRALVDDSHFSTAAPPPLPAPSSVTTLSARLAALRAADMTQGSSLRKQKQQQEWSHDEKRHASPGASAPVTRDTALLANVGLSARRDDAVRTSTFFFVNDASGCNQQNEADTQRLQQSSAVVDSSAANATSDHDFLVRSPPSKGATLPTAKARQAQRASRQEETSFIVSLAQQLQATREEAWRDAQGSVTRALPARPPPPLPPPNTSVLANAQYASSHSSPEHRRGSIAHNPAFARTTTTARKTAAAAANASSRALIFPTTPLDALQERLLPPALATAAAGGGVVENHSLSMHEELAMRERLAARRGQQQRKKTLSMRNGVGDDQRQRYERLIEARDRDVAEHICGEVARQMAVQVAAQARVEQVRAALPDQPTAVTSGELAAIRLHAQQLERLREQMHLVVERPPSYYVKGTSASTTDVVSSTDSSSSSIPATAAGKSCRTAAPQPEHIKEGVAEAAQQAHPTAGEQGDAHNSSETVVVATASMRTGESDGVIGTRSVVGDRRRGAGTPSLSTQSTAFAEREATPERTVEAHRAPSPSSSLGLAQAPTAEAHPQTAAPPARRSEQVTGKPTDEVVERCTSDSLSEDWLTSTQLPPRSSAAEVQAGPRAKTPSPAPVMLLCGASPSSASHANGSDPGRRAPVALVPPSVFASAHAGSSPAQHRNALAVSADDDAEHDLISSSPPGGYSDRGCRDTESMTPERLAWIQSTQLHVSPSRGTAWQENSVASDSSSSSSSRLLAPVSSLRDARSTSRNGGSPRPPALETRSSLPLSRATPSLSASLQRSATPAAHGARRMGAASTCSSASTSPRATTSLALLSKGSDPMLAHRRAVQREVDKRTAMRAQALLSEHGVAVDVQLAARRVPSLVKLSRDGKELLFYLERIEQVSQRATRASPVLPLPTLYAQHAPRSLPRAAVVSPVPKTGGTPATMGRAPYLSASSPPPAAQPPPLHPPLIPGARVPIAPFRQPNKVLVKMPPAGTLVKRKVIVGRGGAVVRAPPQGFVHAYPQAQQQRFVAAAPPQSGGGVPLPSPSPLPPRVASAALLRRDPSPSATASTRPVHVRELHHFPCAYSRVYVPFGVMGYERDLGLGGPRTWEDVGGVLCGPASFEVLRRYRCPLFAEVRGPLCVPYRVYLIIPEFKRIDIPQDAVLLVLDFRQRVDWVLFLLAMQHDVADRGDSDSGGDDDALAHSPSRSSSAVRRPVLSYGRALWMLAVQRLQRARALHGMNPFDFDKMWHTGYPEQHNNRGADRVSALNVPVSKLSSLSKGVGHSLLGGSASGRRFTTSPLTQSGHNGGAGPEVRLSSTVGATAPSRGRSGSVALYRDPGLDAGWEVSSATERVGRASHRRSGFRFWNTRRHASPVRSQAPPVPSAETSVAPRIAHETSKPRFQLLKRVSRSLGASRSSGGD
ncbi:hypothetical protein LSCM4_07041 [Leishmania orientalis]|uniref:Uncharacterized protein n=1 Tax=Leishmania orientalis TaxID=2249476 RepID=A0A836HQY7_9TRYP|nr:hypothetical protein LSCM4_07041 [Leishmania orientalis]